MKNITWIYDKNGLRISGAVLNVNGKNFYISIKLKDIRVARKKFVKTLSKEVKSKEFMLELARKSMEDYKKKIFRNNRIIKNTIRSLKK